MALHTSLAPLLKTTRGTALETLHLGVVAAVDGRGELVFSVGDPIWPVVLRSTTKPIQLLPFLLDDVPRVLGWPRGAVTDASLAVMMASHSAEPRHLAEVRRLLELGGLDEADLRCGPHVPIGAEPAAVLTRQHAEPSAIHNNCSGKHAAMLLTCLAHGWDLASYLDPAHPHQRRIRELVCRLSGQADAEVGHGTDGCSAPTFALTVQGLARMFAALVGGGDADDTERAALDQIFAAGVAHPEMVSGQGRLDAAIMTAGAGAVYAKIGAAGAYGMAAAPSERWPHGLGIAIKCADGDAARSLRPRIARRTLEALGVPLPGDREPLDSLTSADIVNCNQWVVGQYQVLL